jgi:hypothetical protein
MFITAIFTIAKIWKHLRYPTLMNGSRKCDIYRYTMEHYSAIRNNDNLWFEGK